MFWFVMLVFVSRLVSGENKYRIFSICILKVVIIEFKIFKMFYGFIVFFVIYRMDLF